MSGKWEKHFSFRRSIWVFRVESRARAVPANVLPRWLPPSELVCEAGCRLAELPSHREKVSSYQTRRLRSAMTLSSPIACAATNFFASPTPTRYWHGERTACESYFGCMFIFILNKLYEHQHTLRSFKILQGSIIGMQMSADHVILFTAVVNSKSEWGCTIAGYLAIK